MKPTLNSSTFFCYYIVQAFLRGRGKQKRWFKGVGYVHILLSYSSGFSKLACFIGFFVFTCYLISINNVIFQGITWKSDPRTMKLSWNVRGARATPRYPVAIYVLCNTRGFWNGCFIYKSHTLSLTQVKRKDILVVTRRYPKMFHVKQC